MEDVLNFCWIQPQPHKHNGYKCFQGTAHSCTFKLLTARAFFFFNKGGPEGQAAYITVGRGTYYGGHQKDKKIQSSPQLLHKGP